MSLRGKTAITGIGETAYERGATKTAFQLQVVRRCAQSRTPDSRPSK